MPTSSDATRMRLDRFVSQATGLSRSRVKLLLLQKRIRVNAATVRDAATVVSPALQVYVDDELLDWPRHHYVMLHKPVGVVCSNTDPLHTPVQRLVERPWAVQLHAAGRLDVDTTGLVLLTSDGGWSHALTSPRRHCEKVYRVRVQAPLDPALVRRFADGLLLRDDTQLTLPARLEPLGTHEARVTLREGRYHQVRRMFAACGNHVAALHRERIGTVSLDPVLAPGQWRELSDAEVEALGHG